MIELNSEQINAAFPSGGMLQYHYPIVISNVFLLYITAKDTEGSPFCSDWLVYSSLCVSIYGNCSGSGAGSKLCKWNLNPPPWVSKGRTGELFLIHC